MARPDVRVRLSAEGVAEVVSALKKIQTEGQKAATKSKTGFTGLNKALGGTRNLLGGLGIVLGVSMFKRFLGGAIEAADQINKLGAKVGATTENLSALQLVARTADADLNQVGAALIRMNKNLGDAMAGVPKAVGFLEDLGLSLKNFKGKDSVEIFAMISTALMGLEDQLIRDRIAIGLFGRSGAQLKPVMKALADEGLGAVIERARELGVLLDHDLAAASEQIKDDVEILKMQSEAMGIHFMSGFGPEMSRVLQVLSGDLGSTGDAWEEFGAGVGRVTTFVVGHLSALVDIVTAFVAAIAVTLVSLGKTMTLAAHFDFDGARRELQTHQRWWEREVEAITARMRERLNLVYTTPPPAGGDEGSGSGVAGGGETKIAELAARKAQALMMSLDRELALIKTSATLRTKEEQREFKRALQNVTEYYADRRTILESSYAAELAALNKKEALLDDYIDPALRLQEEKKIESQRATAGLKFANAKADLADDELDTVKALSVERLALERDLLLMQGERIAAERLGFEERIAQADLLLRKQGVSDAEREATLARLRTALESGSAFEEAKQKATDALGELGAARQEIEARARAGLISSIEAETQLLAIEETRIVRLRELAETLEAAAFATGDPEKIEQARAFTASINEIAYAIEGSMNAWTQFKTAGIDAARSALEEFLATGLDAAGTVEEKFNQMAAGVILALKRVAAELLTTWMIQKMTGLFDWVGPSAEFIGPMPAKAQGGLIRGPGTGTSDSIAAWLSNKEFVTKASVVNQPGVLNHLHALNRYGARALVSTPSVMPGFAEGGLVGASMAGDDGRGLDGRLTLGLEDGLVIRDLETPEGQRVTIETIRKNKRAVRSALGI